MMIDVFNHFMPKAYLDRLGDLIPGHPVLSAFPRLKTLWDVDSRRALLDEFPGTQHVLSLANPPPELIGPPGKTPELVRKEIWAHVLPYNFIRSVLAQAAAGDAAALRSIRFKAALQVLEAFRPRISHNDDRDEVGRAEPHEQLLKVIAVHRAVDRLDRSEPRMTRKGPWDTKN